jgi:hypothetical protein
MSASALMAPIKFTAVCGNIKITPIKIAVPQRRVLIFAWRVSRTPRTWVNLSVTERLTLVQN